MRLMHDKDADMKVLKAKLKSLKARVNKKMTKAARAINSANRKALRDRIAKMHADNIRGMDAVVRKE